MGAALCLCPGGRGESELRLDKPHRLSQYRYNQLQPTREQLDALLQTQSGAETRGMLSDEEREMARRMGLGLGMMPPLEMTDLAEVDRVEDATESDEAEFYQRHWYGLHAFSRPHAHPHRPARSAGSDLTMPATTAAAFRAKLKEPSMSPASKFRLLGARVAKALQEDPICGKDHDEAEAELEIEPISDGNPAEEDDDEDDEDEDEYFQYVRIIVPPGPCGVVFQPQTTPNMPPTVERFERMYDGRKGVIENCALVQRGSVLLSINDLDVTHIPLPDLLRALTLSSHVEREFVFRK